MNKKIAIYSGIIPSTTFIESLINAIALEKNTIFLFGDVKKNVSYQNKNILVYPFPKSEIGLFSFVAFNCIKLFFQSRKNYSSLKNHIESTSKPFRQRIRLWAKYLPVVIHAPEIFHVQWTSSTSEWMFLKYLFGIKIVVSLRGVQVNINPITDSFIANQYRSFFKDVDGFHAVSNAISNEALKYGTSKDKIKVIYSGVDLKKIIPFEKIIYSSSKPLRIISIGRFHWTKGFNYALDALSNLLESEIDFHYTIVSNKIPEEILYQIDDLKLTSRVTVLRTLPQHEVFKLMQECDLLLLPSVEEGIANVVLEAMAIGLPVISSDCGGMKEVIEDGINGFLFNARNTPELSEVIKSFIQLSPEKRSEITVAAKRKLKEQHGLNEMGIKMNEFYERILCA